MGTNGKNKGSSFERKISKELSLFLSNNERDDLFWRSQNSGGRFTIRIREGLDTHNQSGDITNTHKDSEWFINAFSIECKHYKDINIWSIVTGSKSGLIDFWNQCKRDAYSVNKNPLLIVRQNYKPELLITDEKTSDKFESLKLSPTIKVFYNEMCIFIYSDFLKMDSSELKKIFL